MNASVVLSSTGLVAPTGFPASHFEATYRRIVAGVGTSRLAIVKRLPEIPAKLLFAASAC